MISPLAILFCLSSSLVTASVAPTDPSLVSQKASYTVRCIMRAKDRFCYPVASARKMTVDRATKKATQKLQKGCRNQGLDLRLPVEPIHSFCHSQKLTFTCTAKVRSICYDRNHFSTLDFAPIEIQVDNRPSFKTKVIYRNIDFPGDYPTKTPAFSLISRAT